jgi:hypothetical protein
MKEDILEQLVEDWLVAKIGWFVKHNVKFRPSKNHPKYNPNKDSVHSDIDILAFSNREKGIQRVAVVTCKSWQGGFNAKKWKEDLEVEPEYNERREGFQPRERWKYFREITSDKWIEAFVDKIEEETGQRDFEYYIVVTKLNGRVEDKVHLQNSKVIVNRFKKYKSNVNIKIITLEEIINDYYSRIKGKDTPSLEATDVGRLLQLIHAADLQIKETGHGA